MDFDSLSLLEDITLVHCIDDIMLIGPNEQEVGATIDLLVRLLHVRECKINTAKTQEPSISAKFLGVQWCGAY